MIIDVFLSRKSQDASLARQLLDFLVNKGLSVFDSDDLPKYGSSDYRKSIDNILDKVTHLIIIGSSVENIESPWVEAEWGIFINEKRAGRKLGNLNLITVVDHKILIKDLPPSLRYYEVIPFDERNFEKIYAYVSVAHTGKQAVRQAETEPVNDVIISDFVIKSDKYARLNPDMLIPMALQNQFNYPLSYLHNVKWNSKTSVPYFIRESWRTNQRQLPDLTDYYPWLTVSDFLEPYLIQLPYPINRSRFFDGNLHPTIEDKGYLLPLKKVFFDFFDLEDLYSGHVRLKMTPQAGGIQISLDIPIKAPNQPDNQFVTFKRQYVQSFSSKAATPNEIMNEGIIVRHTFTVNIYPIVQSGSVPVVADFRIQVIESGFDDQNQYELMYYWQPTNELVPVESKHQRTVRQQNMDGSSVVYVLREEFDYLQVSIKNKSWEVQGLLIPNWIKYNGGYKEFSFSIDFSTSKTDVEYHIDGSSPRPFDVGLTSPHVASLVNPAKYNSFLFELFLLYDLEFVPAVIGPNCLDSFPTRTAIAESMNLNFNQQTQPLADFNIPFYAERQPAGKNRINTYLQLYATSDQNERRAEAFLEELFMLIKNKVLLEGGDLYKTKIYWLYPSRLYQRQMEQLRSNWQSLYDRYIGGSAESLIEVSKAVVPYYYYKQNSFISAHSWPVINVDIGDDISEVVIYECDELKLLTSFQFGSNAIYGDAFSEFGAANQNGFVCKYADRIQAELESQELDNLIDLNQRLLDHFQSKEIMSFWFSLVKRNEVKIKSRLSLEGMLAKDEDLKVVFVLYFTALIYYLARLMKYRGMRLPGTITFSGNGGRELAIVSSDQQLLGNLAQLIFEKVYEQSYEARSLTLFYERKVPKQIQCKAALMQPINRPFVDLQALNYVYQGTFSDEFPTLIYTDLRKPEVIGSILTETNTFIDFFFAINKEFSFVRHLNISARSLVLTQQELRMHLSKSLKEGIERKESYVASEYFGVFDALGASIDETLFFYPLIGAFNKIAYAFNRY